MKWMSYIVSAAAVIGILLWWQLPNPSEPAESPVYLVHEGSEAISTNSASEVAVTAPRSEVIAENLTIPWEIVFLPDGELLITERPGNVLLLKQGVTIPLEGIRHVGEGGLLGAALHPRFAANNQVYFYQTTETDAGITNRIVRYTLVGEVNDGNAHHAWSGVAGHAGLFSTARELASLLRLLLEGGTLDGTRYLSAEVVDAFLAESVEGQALGWQVPSWAPEGGIP